MNIREALQQLMLEDKKLTLFLKGGDVSLMGFVIKVEDDFLVFKRWTGPDQAVYCHIPFESISYFQLRK